MEQVTMVAGGGGVGYADSVDSSPRSHGGEFWDEPFSSSAAAAASRLRLMCSYGGHIVPRPTDRSLYYLGGETQIVVVDRHSSLADLSTKLSRSLLGGSSFSLKYQLPNEELDSLISVTTDEDLDNMIEEYNRIIQSSAGAVGPGGGGGNIGSSRSNRLRLFLFPSKPESTPSSIGSLLDDSKSEIWFVDALNSAMGRHRRPLPRSLRRLRHRQLPPRPRGRLFHPLSRRRRWSPRRRRHLRASPRTPPESSRARARMSTPSGTSRCSTRHLPLDPPRPPPHSPTRPPPHSPALVGRHGSGSCGPYHVWFV